MSDDTPELDRLAEDWIALWESELAALAADPEVAEGAARAVSLWAGLWRAQMAAVAEFARGFSARAPGEHAPRPDAPPRPAAGGAAPDAGREPRGDGGDDLARRLAELERRLAEVERGPRGDGPDPAPPRPARRRKPRRA